MINRSNVVLGAQPVNDVSRIAAVWIIQWSKPGLRPIAGYDTAVNATKEIHVNGNCKWQNVKKYHVHSCEMCSILLIHQLTETSIFA